MANKSTLNLYCQKNKLLIPVYNTEYLNGPPHKQIFKSSLEIYDKKFTSINSSKQLAENDVASLAVQYLSLILPEVKEKKERKLLNIKNITATTSIMIDGDNLDIPNIKYDTFIESVFIIFVAKNNTRMKIFDEVENNNNNVFIISSNSVDEDSTDHCITYYLGKLQLLYPDCIYYIVTKDHFGQALTYFDKNIYHKCDFSFIKN